MSTGKFERSQEWPPLWAREFEELGALGDVAAAPAKLGAVAEDHFVFPVEPRLEFADGVETDETAAIEAHEEFGVKDFLEGIESAANVVFLGRRVYQDVVAIRFDPGDVIDGDKEGALAFANEQALGIAAIPLNLLEQMLQTGFGASAIGVLVVDAGTMESFTEALLNDGLEEVVEGVDFEGAKSVLVVGSDEDDLRQLCGPCRTVLG